MENKALVHSDNIIILLSSVPVMNLILYNSIKFIIMEIQGFRDRRSCGGRTNSHPVLRS